MIHHNPFVQLLKLMKQNHAQKQVNFASSLPWLGKFLLTEPFRQFEKIKTDRKVKKKRLCKDPVFVLGHWRSGTSFLQYLLGQDPQFGYLNKFQAIFPELFLTSENILKPIVKKISKQFETRDNVKDISVNWDWDSPSELDIALTTFCSPASPHWGHTFPHNHKEYFRKYLFLNEATKEDRKLWKKTYDYLIKKLTIENDDKQIVIKSPGNTARIRYLLEMYPNAKFLYIHRNPYDVFYSNIKLWNTLLDILSFQDFDRSQIHSIILDNYEMLLKSYLTDRELIPDNNLVEIRFEEFADNPLPHLEKAYDILNLENFVQAEPEIRHFLDLQKKGGSSGYDYDDDIIQRIDNRWQFSFDEWPYPLPEKSSSIEKNSPNETIPA